MVSHRTKVREVDIVCRMAKAHNRGVELTLQLAHPASVVSVAAAVCGGVVTCHTWILRATVGAPVVSRTRSN